jgi:FKBP-type peptidyl-prolyl cis-trans isomerase
MTRTASGLYYQDLLVGRGAVAMNWQRVRVAYTGWLADGVAFDQSPEGRPFSFILGRGQVIPGWDEGVSGMRVGGRRLLVIPPAMAYGRQSPGAGIPPNATLIFDVRLVQVQP